MEQAQETARRLSGVRYVSYDARAAAAMLTPIAVVLSLVVAFPILYSLYTSFFSLKLTRPHRVPFVGFDNYIELVRSDLFWVSVTRTAAFTVIAVTAITLLALLVALLLNETFRGRRFLAAMLLVPWAIPTVANGLMWKWIYDENFGALNGVLAQLGVIDHYLVWLGDPAKTLALVANAYVWRAVPLATILLLVTMKSIPDVLYRAARVDGAGVLPRFFHITLPSLRPGLVMVLIFETMLAIRHFDLFYILTSGGPSDASHVAAWHVYVETFRNLSFGTGSALAYLMALATFGIAWVVIQTLGRRV
jgi:multiple sugar transport system permease protein